MKAGSGSPGGLAGVGDKMDESLVQEGCSTFLQGLWLQVLMQEEVTKLHSLENKIYVT